MAGEAALPAGELVSLANRTPQPDEKAANKAKKRKEAILIFAQALQEPTAIPRNRLPRAKGRRVKRSLIANRLPDGKSLLAETESLGHLSRERIVFCLGLVEDDAATVDGEGHGLL